MTNYVIWLIGQTCVGKTEFSLSMKGASTPQGSADAAFNLGHEVRVLNVGNECRKLWPASMFVENRNSVSPDISEDFVRETVEKWISVNSREDGDKILIVDSAPRSVDQLLWCERLENKYDLTPLYVVCTCLDEIWKQRVKKRRVDDDTSHLIDRRLLDEPPIMLKVITHCMSSGRPMLHVDLSDGGLLGADEIKDRLPSSTKVVAGTNTAFRMDFRSVWAMHAALNDFSLGRYSCSTALLAAHVRAGQSRPCDLPPTWARRFARKAITELEELLEELPDEWWTEDRADFAAARVELIDVFHFLISLAMALGMTAESFVDTYYGKAEKNLERWKSGTYHKRRSTDSD